MACKFFWDQSSHRFAALSSEHDCAVEAQQLKIRLDAGEIAYVPNVERRGSIAGMRMDTPTFAAMI